MIYAAILGFGVVGSGVAEVCEMNASQIERHLGAPLRIKKILDVRDFSGSPYASLVTSNADEIFSDPDIAVIAETIGGATIAYEFTKQALSCGKSVVTSNKELVSKHGVELMQLAQENRCVYLFEASVGGGIPIIRPLHRCLAANKITKIAGIVNGTTNYILTQMTQLGANFDEALQEAQSEGYAEKNPSADIDGIDAKRKLAILGSIALEGAYVNPDLIYSEGITKITQDDISYAKSLHCKVKLLAIFSKSDCGENSAIVAPYLVSTKDPLAVADGVFNAIIVEGNALGEAMFYGQGAGKLPTASAVVADIIDAALHKDRSAHIKTWFYSDQPVVNDHPFSTVKALLRVASATEESVVSDAFFGAPMEIITGIVSDEVGYIVGCDGKLTEGKLEEVCKALPGYIKTIRIYK